MKILYDGIVKSLQSYGGITVYFEEIIKRLKMMNTNSFNLMIKMKITMMISIGHAGF